MTNFNFSKKGVEFKFRNPRLNEFDELILEYRIGEEKNKYDKDGYFYNAEFDENSQTISFSTKKINGKTFNRVRLPDEIYKDLLNIYEQALKERKEKIEEIIEGIIEGEIPIDFGIVGCYYPHYQPWLNNLPEDLKGKEQEIMEETIYRFYEKLGCDRFDIYVSSPCTFLERKLNTGIMNKDNVVEEAFNLEFNKETQNYHGYGENIVTSFQMKLADLINVDKAEIEKKQADRAEIEKRRKALDMEILKQGENNGDYYAIVKLTDPITKESLTFNCRNIFDVGYVINPEYEIAKGIKGGITIDNQWHDFKSGKGWYPVRELTEFEKQCIDYLKEFSPIETSTRL